VSLIEFSAKCFAPKFYRAQLVVLVAVQPVWVVAATFSVLFSARNAFSHECSMSVCAAHSNLVITVVESSNILKTALY